MILSQYFQPVPFSPYVTFQPYYNSYSQVCSMKKIGNYSYDLNKIIGSGSYSQVYRGQNDITKEPVAVKVIDSSNIMDEFVKQLIKNEIETMKQIKNQNVVRLYEVYETTHNLYLIMEYCESGDLRDLLDKNYVLPEKQAINILYQIVRGYKKLLKHNVIHRDIKPENILIHKGVYKITDFGFAIQMDDLRQQIISVPVGTLNYCSPEILAQMVTKFKQYDKLLKAYTNKCDIWSLGILFYEMLFGIKPWPNNQAMQLSPIVRYPINISISQSALKFLQNTLQFRESDRINWDNLLRHKLFKEYEKKFLKVKIPKNKFFNQSEVISGCATTTIEESARSPSFIQENVEKESYKVLQRLKRTLRKINSTVNYEKEKVCQYRQKTYRENGKKGEDEDK